MAITWCLLQERLDFFTFFFGLILSFGVLWYTREFWPYQVKIRKIPLAIKLLFTFIYDVIVANLQVVKLAFTPRLELKPAFIEIPLTLNNDLAITILAFMITLTPGTLSIDLSKDGQTLLIHCVHTENPEKIKIAIKKRFEKPLKEILLCSDLS